MQEAPVGFLVRKLRSHMLWGVTKRNFLLVKVVNFMCYHHKQKKFLEWKREAEEENQRKEKRKKTNEEKSGPGARRATQAPLTFHWWKSLWSSWLAVLKYL